jgi:hypothetical protein
LIQNTKKRISQKRETLDSSGAEGRTRTDMVSLPLDFESSASANFTTSAFIIALLY